MPKHSSSKSKEEQPMDVERTGTNTAYSAPASDGVNSSQIKCIMIGVGIIVVMNLILTIVAIVLGLQIKSEVDGIQTELEPIMEMAQTLQSLMGEEGSGGIGGDASAGFGGNGGGASGGLSPP